MKPSFYAFRSAVDDGLVINEATRHQYYVTMQAEVCDEDLLDEAMNRRQARALLDKQHQSRRLGAWALAVCAALALALWWF